MRTPWCFSLNKEAAGFIKFSARSGTFFIILIEQSAAYSRPKWSKYNDKQPFASLAQKKHQISTELNTHVMRKTKRHSVGVWAILG